MHLNVLIITSVDRYTFKLRLITKTMAKTKYSAMFKIGPTKLVGPILNIAEYLALVTVFVINCN